MIFDEGMDSWLLIVSSSDKSWIDDGESAFLGSRLTPKRKAAKERERGEMGK